MAKCLIVDDSKVIRKVAEQLLAQIGLAVDEAEDGSIALTKCRETAFDVILLDWNMPVMGGMEFLAALNAEPAIHRPKIIFCTTENSQDHIRSAIGHGADEYMMKPFDRDTLSRKLQSVGIL